MILWQKAELLKFGPGDDKSEDIYSWPLVEPCTSDTATLNQDYLNDDFINKNTIKRITGLDSLERLLFSENTDSECETDHETANNWSSITNLNDRRLAYAVVLAKDVRDRALALHDEWKPDAQNFALKFTSAGEGSTSDYSSALEALNDAFAGMFYLDKKTKDRKMGVPIGLIPKSKGAVAIKDSSYIESVYANHSKENLIHNIVGFEMLFLGGTESDYGFDDLLTDLGTEGATLATRMKTNITSAKTALNNITGTLKAAIDDNANTKDDEAYAAVKAITDDLKNGFVSLLGLRVPEEGESDVD
jgi:hypothetical protein